MATSCLSEPEDKISSSVGSGTETGSAAWDLKEGYPATALIRKLLKHFSRNFTNYKRHKNLSKSLLKEWMCLYDTILTHVEVVQKEDGPYRTRLDSFIKYSAAIVALEK